MNALSNRSAIFGTFLMVLLGAATLAHAAERDSPPARPGNESGRLQTEHRDVSGYRAVELRGSMNLELRQGAREGMELRGDGDVLPLIETRVVDRSGIPTLQISMRRGAKVSSERPVELIVDFRTLTSLSLAGSGNVRAEALKTPTLRISIGGSGNLRISGLDSDALSSRIAGSGNSQFAGRATKAAFSIAGNGDVDSAALESDDVSVEIAGSGDAKVTARKTLTVSIAGSGDVSYGGDPQVKSSVAGSGSVHKR